jgi:hypothetical protein
MEEGLWMPGINDIFFVLAFDENEHGEAVPVSKPRGASSAADAMAAAQSLSEKHDRVVPWKQHINPAIGEAGAPEVLMSRGHTRDFA